MNFFKKYLPNWVTKHRDIVIIFGIYCVNFVILSPLREMSLKDDWAYAWSVNNLLSTGSLKVSDWSSATLIFQVLWGAGFASIFGYSFGILRLSTILLSFFGVTAFYYILKELKIREPYCFLGTLLLIVNPLFFDLTYSFMTDVPCLSLMLISILFYLKGINTNNRLCFLLGSIFVSFAFLTRQIGIFIAFDILIYCLINKRKFKLSTITSAVVIPFITLFGYFIWTHYLGNEPWAQATFAKGASLNVFFNYRFFIIKFIVEFFYILQYAGLFLAPLLAFIFLNFIKNEEVKNKISKPRLIVSFLVAILLTTLGFMFNYFYKDYLFNLNYFNIMPFFNAKTIFHHFPTNMPSSFWFLLTLISTTGAILLIVIVFNSRHIFLREKALFFPITTGIFILALTLLHFRVVDRYVIMLIPFLYIYLFKDFKPGKYRGLFHSLFYVAIIFSFIYSVSNTLVFHNFKEAQWKAGKYLLDKGVPNDAMDVSFEWNGYWLFQQIQTIGWERTIEGQATYSLKKTNHNCKIADVSFNIPWISRVTRYIFEFKEKPYNTKKGFVSVYGPC